MIDRPIVVIKVGGSLLDWAEFPAKLAEYLLSRRDDRLVLVVGGGRFADSLRCLDRRHQIGEERSHAMALRVLDLTAWLVADLVRGLEVAEELEAIVEVWDRGLIPVLAPRKFLDEDDQSPEPLPHSWTTTTDSIAARLAVRLEASEVVLLKSAPMERGSTVEDAMKQSLVDPEFPWVSRPIPKITYHDFRHQRIFKFS